MVMLLKIQVYVTLICIVFSCSGQVPNKVSRKFKYCYEPTSDYSNSKLLFNGYYIMKHYPLMSSFKNMEGNVQERLQDTTYNVFMFFKDGFFRMSNTRVERVLYDLDYLKSIEQKVQPEYHEFFNYEFWGIYKFFGDTLKLQYLSHQPRFNPYWTLIEVWYVMVDEKTLKKVYAFNYTNENDLKFRETSVGLEFIETKLNLSSDSWLKYEKWLWCNEQQYRLWKKEH